MSLSQPLLISPALVRLIGRPSFRCTSSQKTFPSFLAVFFSSFPFLHGGRKRKKKSLDQSAESLNGKKKNYKPSLSPRACFFFFFFFDAGLKKKLLDDELKNTQLIALPFEEENRIIHKK